MGMKFKYKQIRENKRERENNEVVFLFRTAVIQNTKEFKSVTSNFFVCFRLRKKCH